MFVLEFETGVLQGRRLSAVKEYLRKNDLDPPSGALGYTVNVIDDDCIAATGSLDGIILKYIAVSPEHRGDGLCAKVVSHLVQMAILQGNAHIFIYTKPENEQMFSGISFYPVATTDTVLLMENIRDGVKRFVQSIPHSGQRESTGAIVANCDPFTFGHMHLARFAAQSCDRLYFFVVSEDRGHFSAQRRFELVRENMAELKNVIVCPTDGYMVSAATFPTYFIKDKNKATDFSAELDLTIFSECFAKPLGITKRFVGEEPFCLVTSEYNRQMSVILPKHGIQLVVIPRLEQGGIAVSASRVRELFYAGELEQLRPLVPEATYHFLCEVKRHENI